jgi:LysR family transcriptional regulator, hydrogen peroxide-inducible genes activator
LPRRIQNSVSVAHGNSSDQILAVCEQLNFTQAARQCHVTQPSLTRAIQRLEKEFGGYLFWRERPKVELTDLGKLVRP